MKMTRKAEKRFKANRRKAMAGRAELDRIIERECQEARERARNGYRRQGLSEEQIALLLPKEE